MMAIGKPPDIPEADVDVLSARIVQVGHPLGTGLIGVHLTPGSAKESGQRVRAVEFAENQVDHCCRFACAARFQVKRDGGQLDALVYVVGRQAVRGLDVVVVALRCVVKRNETSTSVEHRGA